MTSGPLRLSNIRSLSLKLLDLIARFVRFDGTSPLARRTVVALGLGFSCVAATVYSLGGEFGKAIAGDNGGMYDFLAQNRSQKSFFHAPIFYTPAYRAPAVYAPGPYRAYGPPPARGFDAATTGAMPLASSGFRKRFIRGFANLPVSILPLHQSRANQPRALAGAIQAVGDASGLPRRSVCVRLCDGYFFPVAPIASDGDLTAHESLCAGVCPGAPTRLFVMPGGSEHMEDATSRDGKRYSALPVAFRHTGTSDNTCTCRPDNIAHSKLVSVLKDFTLRHGDMVMTNKGVRVFRGSNHWPYGQADFMSLAESGINSKNRAALSAIEQVTRRGVARVTESVTGKPESASARISEAVVTGSPTDGTSSLAKPVRHVGPPLLPSE